MRTFLHALGGRKAGTRIELPNGTFLIGRDSICHLRPKSDTIAPRHCAILSRDSQHVVQDLGSATGTYLNDERVRGCRPLSIGDRLQIGPLVFQLMGEISLKGEPAQTATADPLEDTGLWQAAPGDADVLLAEVPGCNDSVPIAELHSRAATAARHSKAQSLGVSVAYAGVGPDVAIDL
jgi:pSer/pThr/pTyr-binding forkhead associated (FHA) protein